MLSRVGVPWLVRTAGALLLLLGLLRSSGLAGEPRDLVFTAKIDGSQQRYVEWLPEGFDKAKQYDVLIALHGHGADRWQFIRESRGECRGVRDVAARHQMILVSPDYRARTSWMGPPAEADVLQLLDELQQRYQVGRIFVAGGSMGGTSALIFASLHPQQIAGVVSLNGTANMLEYDRFQDAIVASYGGSKQEKPEVYRQRSPELWPERLTMPVAVTTGGRDDVVPPDSVLRLVQRLQQDKRRVLSIHREAGGHQTDYGDTCAALEFVISAAEKGGR